MMKDIKLFSKTDNKRGMPAVAVAPQCTEGYSPSNRAGKEITYLNLSGTRRTTFIIAAGAQDSST